MRLKPLTLVGVLLAFALLLPAVAQQPVKPFHDGTVWDIVFVRVKAGMTERYLRHIAGEWKREQDAIKKAGYIMDYKVIVTEPHSTQDYNVILMTQFKDLASLEGNSDKIEALAMEMFGGQQKVESGYEERASYREVVGNRLGREIILEPKRPGTK